jgi:7,8-dihydropterin-6-yl-methyl-4-(beta-D-ribofuranosyl)aminobenzene 5'-phosphate synthase
LKGIRLVAEASKKRDRLFRIWGVSFLIDDDVLFDTFSNERTLAENMERFGIDVRKIKHVVISHEHWDHTGGLRWLLSKTGDVTLYICAGSSGEFKEEVGSYASRIVEVGGPICIRDDVFSTGEMETRYRGKPLFEQALFVRTGGANALVTGCSHPGIVEIAERARSIFECDIGLVAGGFHLLETSNDEISLAIDALSSFRTIKRIAPMHCTGPAAMRSFKRKMKGAFVQLKPGDSLAFEAGRGE